MSTTNAMATRFATIVAGLNPRNPATRRWLTRQKTAITTKLIPKPRSCHSSPLLISFERLVQSDAAGGSMFTTSSVTANAYTASKNAIARENSTLSRPYSSAEAPRSVPTTGVCRAARAAGHPTRRRALVRSSRRRAPSRRCRPARSSPAGGRPGGAARPRARRVRRCGARRRRAGARGGSRAPRAAADARAWATRCRSAGGRAGVSAGRRGPAGRRWRSLRRLLGHVAGVGVAHDDVLVGVGVLLGPLVLLGGVDRLVEFVGRARVGRVRVAHHGSSLARSADLPHGTGRFRRYVGGAHQRQGIDPVGGRCYPRPPRVHGRSAGAERRRR